MPVNHGTSWTSRFLVNPLLLLIIVVVLATYKFVLLGLKILVSAVQFRLWPPFFETHPVLVSFSLNKSQVSINFEQNDFIPANNQQMLSKNQIKSDIQVIELALNKAYIGSGYLPKENFQKLIFAINSLKASESLSAVDLCKEIEKSLSVAQDNHISIRLNKDRCS